MVLQIQKECLIHLVFRIFAAGLMQLVQSVMTACTPCGKIHPFTGSRVFLPDKITCHSSFIAHIRQAIPEKIQLTFLLVKTDIHIKLTTGRSNNPINQFLIRTFYHNLSELVSIAKLLFMKQIFNLIMTAYKVLVCYYLAGNFQKISGRLHIKAQMSPSTSLYIEGFLHRILQLIVFFSHFSGTYGNLFLFACGNKKFFQMLIGNRLFG